MLVGMAGFSHERIPWPVEALKGRGRGDVAGIRSSVDHKATQLGLRGGRLCFVGEARVRMEFLYRIDLPFDQELPGRRLSWSAFTIALPRERAAYPASSTGQHAKRIKPDKQHAYVSTFPYHSFDRFAWAPFRGGIKIGGSKRHAWYRKTIDPAFRSLPDDLLSGLVQVASRRSRIDYAQVQSYDRVATLGRPVRPAKTPLTLFQRPRLGLRPWEVIGVGPPIRTCWRQLWEGERARIEELLMLAREGRILSHPGLCRWNAAFRERSQAEGLAGHADRAMRASLLWALGGPVDGLEAGDELFGERAPVMNLAGEIYLSLMHHINRQLLAKKGGQAGSAVAEDPAPGSLGSMAKRLLGVSLGDDLEPAPSLDGLVQAARAAGSKAQSDLRALLQQQADELESGAMEAQTVELVDQLRQLVHSLAP